MNHQEVFQEQYKKLNEQQKQAVDSIYGTLMVVAGPGTGKTQIIGLRTANIILKGGIDPENILITTFTEAGVVAIRERLLSFIGNDAYRVNVSTLHSLAQDIIKSFPEKFLEYKAGTPIDEIENLEILKSILDKLIENKEIEQLTSDYDKHFYLRDISSRIGQLKQEGISFGKFKKSIQQQAQVYSEELSEIKPTLKKYETTKEKQEKHILKLEELLVIYKAYNSYLRENSRYDFNDMINFVLDKFETDDEIKYHYAEKFQFIMLDEYQDTNNAQNTIINQIVSLSQDTPNIMVVGDDDQSIYRFQGANIENMLDFSQHFPKTEFIVLENNYRSNQQILDTAKVFIENNDERLSNKIQTIDKKLNALGKYKESKNIPTLYKAVSDIDEQAYIIENIKKLLEQEHDINEIAVIVRGNREVEQWTQLLQHNHIHVESKLKTDILQSEYINFILKYLEIIADPYANEHHFVDIIRTDILGLNQVDILKINRALYIENYSKKYKVKLIDYLNDKQKLNNLNLKNIQLLFDFSENLFDLSSILHKKTLSEFMHVFLETTGILEYVEKNGTFDDIEDIYTLLNVIKQYNSFNKNLTVEELLYKIELYKTYNYPIARQIIKKQNAGVVVLTAHGSKGLEYDTVFIPGLYTGNWENKRMIDRLKLPLGIAGEGLQASNFNQIEEDRRLFFVAITRAKNNLHLSYPAGIGTKPLLQSSFIEEISGYYKELEDDSDKNNVEQVTINNLKAQLINYGSDEFDYITEFLENYKISPSDLNVFLEDPLEFLHRVVFKYPFMDNKFTIFGKVYHRTLELFYLHYKKEGKLPEKSYLTSTFKLLLDKEILTPEEYEELLKKGVQGLEGYYDLYSESKREPLMLEYSLRRKNIEFEGIPLTGTIDKVEKIGLSQDNMDNREGQMAFFKDEVALIDYKTGSVKSPGIIKGTDRYGNKKPGEGKYFRQLLFYKLLCESDYEFSSSFNVGAIALDFVEGKKGNYKYIEIENSLEEFEYFKDELRNARKNISDINFWKNLLNKS